jgi:D-sedoheptulose 7-phosphate isomerase
MIKKINFTENYFQNLVDTISKINSKKIEQIIDLLKNLRKKNGRLFIVGVGGSAGNASHAVNDFRRLCNIDAISPVDNFSEFTAATNDEGFEFAFIESLKISKINKKDILLVMSVGGGDLKKNSSVGLINAIKLAKSKNCKIISFTGKKDGYAGLNSNLNVHCDVKEKSFLTPFSESMQAVIWHFIVSHPKLQSRKCFW